jgi:oxygen-independent coproporphyrinogen-3 oxidase
MTSCPPPLVDRALPRYTSYPTAPHFHAGIDGDTYGRWLDELAPDLALSAYVHVPYCDTLCWFCGCNTRITQRYRPVAQYLDTLVAEVDLVADRLVTRRVLQHLHCGGGSPTILEPRDIIALGTHLARRFRIADDAEFAVEIDPRGLDRQQVAALAEVGVTRASLGVQDIAPEVQQAINRVQPFDVTRRVAEWLREAGITALNVDLMYGLPHQTAAHVAATVDAILTVEPARVSLFGYAHVPWMKTHQRLIPVDALPDGAARIAQLAVARDRLERAGYHAIGLDHFARPDDRLAIAARSGRLHRNFQGYTTDDAPALVGLGASAIGALPAGYVQNETDIRAWQRRVRAGTLPTARGIALTPDDRFRARIIERLMCDLSVDLAEIARVHGRDPAALASERRQLESLAAEGVVVLDGMRVTLPEASRALVRVVAAVFDVYLGRGTGRHSRAA